MQYLIRLQGDRSSEVLDGLLGVAVFKTLIPELLEALIAQLGVHTRLRELRDDISR